MMSHALALLVSATFGQQFHSEHLTHSPQTWEQAWATGAFQRHKALRRGRAQARAWSQHIWNLAKDGAPISACPCATTALCKPIGFGKAPPARSKEVYGFGGGNGSAVDFSRVTTVAWADNSRIVCAAHAAGARAVMASPAPERALSANVSVRSAWVETTVAAVQRAHMDGVVFDWEAPCPVGSPLQYYYTLLISETRQALMKISPSYQITTCVAWSPDDIDGRGYNMTAFAEATDLLFVMDYDTRSQVFDACIAAANAPFPGTVHGIKRYLDLGISPRKLILGVPWYGYRYPCIEGTSPDARFCPIPLAPFRGINCSDAAGSEVGYQEILRIVAANGTARGWDENQAAPWANVLVPSDVSTGVRVPQTHEVSEHTGNARQLAAMNPSAGVDVSLQSISSHGAGTIGYRIEQYWWDSPESLRRKYAFARSLGLRGVGPYTFSDVESSSDEMYAAFDAFLR